MEKKNNKKLCLYRRFKTEYETHSYVKCMMPRNHRSVYAKCWCWIADMSGWRQKIDDVFTAITTLKTRNMCSNIVRYTKKRDKSPLINWNASIIDLGQRSDTENICFVLSCRDNNIISLFRCLTLSQPQAMIIGFCKQHRSRWDGSLSRLIWIYAVWHSVFQLYI